MKAIISFRVRTAVILAMFFGAAMVSATALAQTSEGHGDDSTNTKPTLRITGRVLTQGGQPVTNATVFVSRLNSASLPRPIPVGSDGSFQVAGLEPGLFGVTASAPSYILPPAEPDSQPAYYRLGDSVNLTMIKGGVINGKVTNADGPVVAVPVRAMMIRDASNQPANNSIMIERQTDDRGIYRLYGLTPGTYVVSAGGGGDTAAGDGAVGGGAFGGGGGFRVAAGRLSGGGFGGGIGPAASAAALYRREAPTFAPSSTRDTAVEITVSAGEDVNEVNIRYRSEPGRAVSGTIKAPAPTKGFSPHSTVTLSRARKDAETVSSSVARGSGFVFYGVADGVYEISAQSSLGPNDVAVSLPQRLTINGSNVSGLVITTNPLGSISGHVVLEKSTAPECKNKREPQFEEIVISAQRKMKKDSQEAQVPMFSFATGGPNKNGDFFLNKLGPGQYRFDTRFFAKYFYLRATTLPSVSAQKSASKTEAASQTTDAALNGVTLKFGSRITGLVVTLAEGAASIHGSIAGAENEKLPPRLFVYLVPAEKEQSENVLRFLTATTNDDGSFALGNLPPGRFWTVIHKAGEGESQVAAKLRMPEGAEARTKLRREGETAKAAIELKPCQNVSDYQMILPRP